MNYSKKQKDAQDRLNKLINKCWEDESFKRELIANPVQTLEKFKGSPVNLPAGYKLVVNDQSASSTLHINIPSRPNFDNMELTDEQLELVSGGKLTFWEAVVVIVLAII